MHQRRDGEVARRERRSDRLSVLLSALLSALLSTLLSALLDRGKALISAAARARAASACAASGSLLLLLLSLLWLLSLLLLLLRSRRISRCGWRIHDDLKRRVKRKEVWARGGKKVRERGERRCLAAWSSAALQSLFRRSKCDEQKQAESEQRQENHERRKIHHQTHEQT